MEAPAAWAKPMKDIVENRRRVSFLRKLKLARLVLRESGVRWCVLLLTYYAASGVSHRAFTAMNRLRRVRNIPGLNSTTLNREIWDAWNWSASGDEWTLSEQWKRSLIHEVLEPEIPDRSDILEIGPGGGRWTEPLLKRARTYVGVDISSSCIEHCKRKFGLDPRARFIVGSGRDLAQIEDSSVDTIWSFDVFVHINRAEVENYVREFARILRPGGIAVVHHGTVGGASGGWRSDLTLAALHSMLGAINLRIVKSIDQWTNEGTVHHLQYDDLITVLRKSAGEAMP